MEIGLLFTTAFESLHLRIWIISTVLKHPGTTPSDNKLLKSIETAGEIRGAWILYTNTVIFMRSVDLFFCLRIRLAIYSLSERGRKIIFHGAPRKFNGEIFEVKIGGHVWKIIVKCFGNDVGGLYLYSYSYAELNCLWSSRWVNRALWEFFLEIVISSKT